MKTQVIVFSDSMGRSLQPQHFHSKLDVTIHCRRGAKLDKKMAGEILECVGQTSANVVLVLHFGTNNIGCRNHGMRRSPNDFKQRLTLLLNKLRMMSNVSVVVSSILPRITEPLTETILEANKLASLACKKQCSKRVKFAYTYRAFLKKRANGKFDADLGLYHSDGLHLSTRGSLVLAQEISKSAVAAQW